MQGVVNLLGPAWITGVMLLATRIAAVLLLTPVLYAVRMPMLVRLLFVLAVACVLALPLAHASAPAVGDAGALLAAVLREAVIGATLGLGVLMAFAGFTLAGRLVDVQVGFGMAQVLDPLTRERLPILSAVFGLLGALFFFLVDGPHALLRGIAYSLERFPLGATSAASGAADAVLRQGAGLFALGFALVAPIVLGLLLVEFVLGVIARNLPQMNMLAMGIPLKILVGLFALAAWVLGLGAPARRLYDGIAQAWSAWLSTGGGR